MKTLSSAKLGHRVLACLVLALCIASSYGNEPSTAGDTLFADALDAAAQMPRLHSLLISHKGELVLEKYFNGRNRRQTANVKSVSKSWISALVGIAIEQGYIEGLDQPISEFYDEMLNGDSNASKRSITIGNLLSMQAGLETTSFYNYGAWVLSDNWVRFALQQPLRAPPGTRLMYSTGNTHLLSAILTQATGKSTLQFAREELGQPLGFHIEAWPTDPNGIYFGGNNMEITPRQMLAFGELYLNKGRANGRQVIPESWVDLSLQRLAESSRERGRYYGYGWWLRDMAGVQIAYAWGYGGQFILIAPGLDLVVVTTSSSLPGSDRRSHIRRLYDVLEKRVVEAVATVESAAATASVD
ncbi:MAG: serine hydrolase [Gammaproteobacteria bacterium]|nr:serine hydrolase [Gammaproteobacteria bacterium]